MRRITNFLLLTIFVATTAAAGVRVSLVSATGSVQPGQPLTVALRIQHDPHWHTYWRNPGTGLATTIAWDLPPGWSAGEVRWPVPQVFVDATGGVTGQGYEGNLLLPVILTPPPGLAAGESVKLKARAEWLMCSDTCVPGSAPVELELPVGTDTPAANAEWNGWMAQLGFPIVPSNWNSVAVRDGSSVTLTIRSLSGDKLEPAAVRFFPEDPSFAIEQSQRVRAIPDGIEATLKLIPDSTAVPDRIRGVLVVDGRKEGWAIDAPLSTAAMMAPPPPEAGLGGALWLALLGGLVLNLMPCVFPVLGIKILGFVNQSGNDRKKITLHGLVFTLGVLISFWSLAGLLLILRAGGSQLGWGFQLQSPGFVFGMAVFMLVFALNMSGLFEVGLAATGAGANLQMKHGYVGSFFTGALATLVATPCSAPFLAPALGAALGLAAFQSFLVFTAIAVGLSTPYLLLSIFPQAIKLLPRPGAWMETFKQLMAFPLYATVGWLLWVLAGQTKENENALLLISFGFVLVAMAAWLYGRFGQAYGKKSRQYVGRIAAAACFSGGCFLGWPTGNPVLSGSAGAEQIVWEKWSPQAVDAARTAGRYVYVDFTARWCATCQTNKATVLHSEEVRAALAQKKVLLLRADWTNRDPLITAELGRWHRSAVPFNLVYAPDRADPVVLPELLSARAVLTAIR